MGEPTPVSSGPGTARRGGSSGVRGRAGAASFREEAGIDRGGGLPLRPGALLHWNAPGAVRGAGMLRARGRAWGPRGYSIHSPGCRRGLTKRRRRWEGMEELEWADVELDGRKEGFFPREGTPASWHRTLTRGWGWGGGAQSAAVPRAETSS